MAAFEYLALDARGKTQKGVLEGDNARQIRQKLREQNLTALEVSAAASTNTPEAAYNIGKRHKRLRISAVDLTIMTRQLATLVKSGTPVERALLSVSQQSDKQKVTALLVAMRAKVLEGNSLAAAFASYPHVFPEIFRSTIAAGEASGHLDSVLLRLADYAERRHEMGKKMLENLLYPIMVVLLSLAILGLLLGYVVPQVVQIFESNDAPLPLITKVVIAISELVQGYWWLLFAVVIGSWVFYKIMMKSAKNRFKRDLIYLRLPMFGSVIRARNAAAFARTLGILSGSSVPVLQAMSIAADVVANLPMQEAVQAAKTQVQEGGSIAKSLAVSRYFPPMMIHLIGSGEESGNLDEMLISAADYQELEVQAKTSAAMAVAQPLMIVVLGMMVLGIMFAVLMPIFNMSNLIQS